MSLNLQAQSFIIDPYRAAVAAAASNYIGWWDFDNDSTQTDGVTDLIGTNDGTAESMEYADFNTCVCWPYTYQLISTKTPLHTGGAGLLTNATSVDLDGTAEYINIPDSDDLSFTDDIMHFSAWVNMDDATSFVILEKEAEYLFWVNATDKLEARFIDAEGDYKGRTYNTAITSDQGSWNHYAATFDGTTVKIYRNGIQVDDTDANSGTYGSMTNTANALTLGYDGTNYADGKLDQVLISGEDIPIDSIKQLIGIRDYNDATDVFGGFAWDLDGSAEYISVADNDLLSFTNDTITISGWVEADDLTNFVIAEKEGEYLLWVNASDKLEARFIDSGGDYIGRTYNTAIPASWQDQWMHVAATLDSNNDSITIFWNGVAVDDTDANSGVYDGMSNTANALTLGYDGTNYANGRIGDVIIYDEVLTAAQVDAIYNLHEPLDETNEALSANIVGYWRGYNSTNVSSGVLDQSGNGLNGTPTATDDADFQYDYPRAVLDSAGSFDFDGAIEYVTIPDDNSLSFGDGSTDSEFSISAWINMDDATKFRITCKDSTASGSEMQFTTSASDQLAIVCRDLSASAVIYNQKATAITSYEGKWTHVVATYDGGVSSPKQNGFTTYINGAVWGDASSGPGVSGSYTAMENTTSPYGIGINESIPDYANGKIAHVTVCDKKLTLCEVQELYNDGSPVDITQVTFISNVVSHWKLDATDDPTGTVTDIVGSNNGTAKNMEAGDKKTDNFPTN